MPGIIGIFSSEADTVTELSQGLTARAAGARLSTFLTSPRAWLGAVQRQRPPAAASFHQMDGQALALYGHCFDPRSGQQLDAAALMEIFLAEGDSYLDRLEGAFHVVQRDEGKNRLRVLNDRVGTIPLYWFSRPGLFSIAPRMRYLAGVEEHHDPNPGAVVCYLSVGHFLGPNTQVRGIQMLTPATILKVDLNSMMVTQSRYWNLVYEPDPSTSPKVMVQHLGDAIVASTDLLTPAGSRHGIFLSGGWDSRSLLGATLKLDRQPALVVTNGKGDDIPGTDTNMARQFAADLGLPYKFCQRDPQLPTARWMDGVHSGEITTCNNPECFGQHVLPDDFFGDIEFILKGDCTWGSGAPALSRKMSIGKIIPYPLMENVKSVLTPEMARQADTLYEEQIDSVMSHCEMSDWTDRRDYLWQMGGINRYILGLGISDEEHLQVRRPLLTRLVFDVYTKVPRHFRVNKNLFIESIKMFYPELFAYGRNHVGNIAYYYAYMADFVRERTLGHLADGHDLWGMLDRDACREVLEAFRPTEPLDYIPGKKARLRNHLHDKYSYLWHRTPFFKERNIKQFKTSNSSLAFHIYLLLEWFHGHRAT